MIDYIVAKYLCDSSVVCVFNYVTYQSKIVNFDISSTRNEERLPCVELRRKMKIN